MSLWVPPQSPADEARYQSIAEDFAEAAEEAPLFEGEQGSERTAVTMAAIASLESYFADDVDRFRRRGDGGRAVGLMQVHLLPGETCPTRLDCLRIGRERVRLSMNTCRRMPEHERLSQFTTGHCQTNAEGRWRFARAKSAWRRWVKELGS